MTKKKLMRSRTDSKVAGVCGGIADYLGVDSTLVRILWLLFGIFVGYGLIIYIVLAMVVPKEPLSRPYDEPKESPVQPEEPVVDEVNEEATQEDDDFNYDNYDRSDDYDESSFYERDEVEETEEKERYQYDEFDERPKRNINSTYLGLAIILIGVYFGIKVFIPMLSMKIVLPIMLIGAGILLLSRSRDGDA